MPRTRLRGPLIALLVGGALITAAGCAAYKASQQPDKKNLALLAQGIERTQLIAEFGAPVYTEQRGGVLSDIFVFKQGYSRGEKAGRAFVHGTADVFTGGLWEVVGIPIETLASGSEVKLEVLYDNTDRVQQINVLQGGRVIRQAR